jgi:ERCC4-related helicase
MSAQWSTPEEIAAATKTIAASIDGWKEPAVHAVGISSATSSAETELPHINVGEDYLAALVMAKTIGYSNGTVTHLLTTHELKHAVAGLSPAEACPAYEHPNLGAWREILAELESNPARTAVVVFIGDLSDPVSSEADGSLRSQLPQ